METTRKRMVVARGRKFDSWRASGFSFPLPMPTYMAAHVYRVSRGCASLVLVRVHVVGILRWYFTGSYGKERKRVVYLQLCL